MYKPTYWYYCCCVCVVVVIIVIDSGRCCSVYALMLQLRSTGPTHTLTPRGIHRCCVSDRKVQPLPECHLRLLVPSVQYCSRRLFGWRTTQNETLHNENQHHDVPLHKFHHPILHSASLWMKWYAHLTLRSVNFWSAYTRRGWSEISSTQFICVIPCMFLFLFLFLVLFLFVVKILPQLACCCYIIGFLTVNWVRSFQ